jgi:flagellar motor switch protein FliM
MEVLSQSEIEKLLSALGTNAENCCEKHFRTPKIRYDERKIRIYDFKRPDLFSRKQLRVICDVHELLIKQLALRLEQELRITDDFHIAMVDQLTYDEFLRSTASPTALAELEIRLPSFFKDLCPAESHIFIEMNTGLARDFIKKTVGKLNKGNDRAKNLSRYEWMVMKDIFGIFANSLLEVWKKIDQTAQLTVTKYDSDPMSRSNLPDSTMCVLVGATIYIGKTEELLNICYPAALLRKVINQFSALYDNTFIGKKNSLPLINRNAIPVELTAELLRRTYTIKDILGWSIDDILFPEEFQSPSLCFLRCNAHRLFACEIIQPEKRFLIRIKIIQAMHSLDQMRDTMTNIDNPTATALSDAQITISAELGRIMKPFNEILKMDEGTVIALNTMAGEPVDIKANGVLIARGEVVVVDENMGVRITELKTSNAEQ